MLDCLLGLPLIGLLSLQATAEGVEVKKSEPALLAAALAGPVQGANLES